MTSINSVISRELHLEHLSTIKSCFEFVFQDYLQNLATLDEISLP